MAQLIVAEAQPLMAHATASLLTSAGHEVLGSVQTISKLFPELVGRAPGVLLLVDPVLFKDFDLKEFLRLCGKSTIQERLIFHLSQPVAESVSAGLRLKIGGWVAKTSAPERLLDCVDSVVEGRTYFDPAIREQFLALLRGLTVLERDLICLVGESLTNAEIAKRLNLSKDVTKVYLWRLCNKLGVRNRHALESRVRELTINPKD